MKILPTQALLALLFGSILRILKKFRKAKSFIFWMLYFMMKFSDYTKKFLDTVQLQFLNEADFRDLNTKGG